MNHSININSGRKNFLKIKQMLPQKKNKKLKCVNMNKSKKKYNNYGFSENMKFRLLKII